MSEADTRASSKESTPETRYVSLFEQATAVVLGQSINSRHPSWVTVVQYWSASLFVGMAFGFVQTALIGGCSWLWKHRQSIAETSAFPYVVTAVVYFGGFALRRFKERARSLYASTEVFTAGCAAYYGAKRFGAHAADETDAMLGVVSFCGAAYLMVRAHENSKAAADEMQDVILISSAPAGLHPRVSQLLSPWVRLSLFVMGVSVPIWLRG